MIKYFVYELKKSAFSIGCIALVATALYLTSVLGADSDLLGLNENRIYLWIPSAAGGVLAATVPLWMFSYKMKKRSVDLYYSLPLSHTKILAVKYLVGLIAVFAPYTLAYWLGAFTVMGRAVAEIYSIYYLPAFLASVIPIYIIYSMSAFVFTRANKFGDGVMFVVFWAFALQLIGNLLKLLVDGTIFLQNGVLKGVYIYPSEYAPYTPLNAVTTVFQYFIAGETFEFSTAAGTINFAVGTIVNALLAAGATAGIFLFERQAKADNVEQISDSIFGYKVMIPLFTFCLAALTNMEIILIVLIAAGAFGVTSVYKRTLKIGQKQVIILIASLIAGLIIAAVYAYAY